MPARGREPTKYYITKLTVFLCIATANPLKQYPRYEAGPAIGVQESPGFLDTAHELAGTE